MLFEDRPQVRLPPDPNETRGRVENRIQDQVRSLRMVGDAFWLIQYTEHIHVTDEPCAQTVHK